MPALWGCDPEGVEAVPPAADSAGEATGAPDAGPGADVAISNDGSDEDAAPGDTGPVPDACGIPQSCAVSFSYPKGGESKVELFGDFNSWSSGVPMQLLGSTWQTSMVLNHGQTVLYKFVLDGTTWVPDPANPKRSSDGNNNSVLDVTCPSTCGDAGPAPDSAPAPDGGGPTSFDWRDGVMYFVLLDRFHDGNPNNNKPEQNVKTPANWHGGDLQGLLDKIKASYFKDLGINVIWISSPVDAPDGKYAGTDGEDYTGYHGYWPTDLTKVEERLGDLNLLKQVVAEAHKQDIRVVMDYVMNHVHENSPVYAQNKSWFWSLTFNNKSCVCGQGCSWDFDPDRLRCWFMPYLPDFDFTNGAARSYSVSNAIKWLQDTGVDGYRLDAVKHIELSWLTDLRAQVNQTLPGTKFYMVGETFTNSKSLLKQYIDPASKLDGQFDFPLRAELVRVILMRQGSFNDLESFLGGNDGYYGAGAIMGTFLGNHDLPRSINMAEDYPQFGDWDSGKSKAWYNQPTQPSYDKPYQRLAVGFTALLTLPGIPLVYYGDEVGLAGGGDPDNRKPMPWSGLSTDQTWLRSHVTKLTKIRAAHPALRYGTRQQQWVAQDVYAYSMTHGSDKVIVVLNRSDSQQSIFLPGTSYKDLLTGATVSASSVSISARSSLVLQ